MLEIAISNLMSFVSPDFVYLTGFAAVIIIILYSSLFGYSGKWGK